MTTAPLWPDWLDDIWAKSPERGENKKPETLARHTWSVLEKLVEAIHLRPALPSDLGVPHLWNCLFWACFLHDFGKAARGFQERLRGGDKWPHRHEVLSLVFLDWLAGDLSQEESQWICAAIASHHRDAHEIRTMYSSIWLSQDNLLADRIAELPQESLHGLWRWLHECSLSWIGILGLDGMGVRPPVLPPRDEAVRAVKEQGAARVGFWIKTFARTADRISRTDERALAIGTLALRGHVISSDQMASAHTGELPARMTDKTDLLARLDIDPAMLYAHQQACGRTQGSVVLIAPTGSGKTEAALLWACAQEKCGRQAPRLFYALPYQASMNAMYDRLNDTIRGAFPGRVGLEHSRSTLALYKRMLDQDCSPATAERLARWGNNLARLNYYPVRVLSPYQLLKAPFRLKGYESLLTDFFDAVFVLDEIHAYEPARLAIILATARYLRTNFGSRFFIMSATLPDLIQAQLADALGEYISICASADLFAKFRRHFLQLEDGDLLQDCWLARIADSAINGQMVLVCCNTVKRAQKAYREIKCRIQARGNKAEVILLHGRFNARDRLKKEGAVRSACGARSGARRPIVLVATQVIEVSLDLDLDVAYTDPAPLEALIQRFGRVNRRRMMERAPVFVFSMPDDGQHVYQSDLVRASLRVLKKHAGCMIDEQSISSWLGEVYQGEISDRWEQEYHSAYDDFSAGPMATLRAFDSDSSLEDEFYKAFDSIEVLPACLDPEYRRLVEMEPLAASELLVPMRWTQFAQLNRKGLVQERVESHPGIVAAAYDSEAGLRLG